MHLKVKNKTLAFEFLILLFLSLFVFLYGIGSYGLLDKDEPRYCGCALEMLEDNNWIVPQFNFQDRFDKPALYYWLIALSYKFFGISDFTSRLPSACSAILCVLFTWYFAWRVLGSKVALISSLILMSSIEYLILGRRAATDITLCLFFTSAMYSVFLGYYDKDFRLKIFWTILGGLFLGLSILTKGPIGIFLLFAVLTLFLFSRGQLNIKHLKVYCLLLLIALIVAIPWFLLVHKTTDGEFTKVFFFEHNFNRFASVVGEHDGPVWFYIPVILGGFMPWTLFFINANFNYLRKKNKNNINKLILYSLLWILTGFFFFSASTTKLATYILLIYPPMAILSGYWICILFKKSKKIFWINLLLTFVCLLIGIIVGGYLFSAWEIELITKNILMLQLLLCVFLLFFGIFAAFYFARKKYLFLPGIAVSFLISFFLGINFYLQKYYFYSHNDLKDFAVQAKLLKPQAIISYGMFKPSLVFYSRLPVNFEDKATQLKFLKDPTNANKPILIIGHTSEIEKLSRLNGFLVLDKRKKYFLGRVN